MNKSDLIQCGSLFSDSLLFDQIEFVLDQIAYFDKTPTIMGKGDQGNLCKYIKFWESFGANKFVLNIKREVHVNSILYIFLN